MPIILRVLLSLVISLLLGGGFSGCTKSQKEAANVIRLAHPEKVKGLDPIYADDEYIHREALKSYETLLQYHYLKRPFALVANLAESMPEISADGRTYTLRLKKGVLFQDDPCFKETAGKGRELIAEDFVYSIKRLADPKLLSTGWWTVDGKIVGLNAWHDQAAKNGTADYTQPIAGLRAVDRYTIEIKLVNRASTFPYVLAMPFTAIVPHEAVEFYGREFNNHAVGTGAFKLVEFSPTKIIWVRNPTFRTEFYPSEGEPKDKDAGLLAEAGKPIPFVDRVEVEVYEQWQPMWLNFLAGKLDRTMIPKDNYAQAIEGKELSPELKAKGIRLAKYDRMDVTHITFNMADPLLGKNKTLRQALRLAYDADRYIELIFNGRAIPAQGPIPPEVPGYDPNFKNPYRQFNLEKAKELLAKAGYPGGKGLPELIFLTTAGSDQRQATEYVAQNFKAIGVRLDIQSFSWPEFMSRIRSKKGQLWSYAWNVDYPAAENFLQLFYSKNVSPGPNDANYSNPEYDRLYEKAALLPEGPERSALYQQMVNIVVEDCPWIFQVHRLGYHLTSPGFTNYKPSPFDHAMVKYYKVERKVAPAK